MNVLLLRDVAAVLLAGGAGERLYPLTKDRAKPAVSFGGPYRIVDFTLSNCVNSGLRKIFIATQYKAQSLNRQSLVLELSNGARLFGEILPAITVLGITGPAPRRVYQNLTRWSGSAPW